MRRWTCDAFNKYIRTALTTTTANCGLSPKNWKIQSTLSKGDISGKSSAYTKNITNIELYTNTKTEEWNTTIRRRRLNWLGHLMRLHPETPARLALAEYVRKVKRPKGRQQRTWMELIKHDLKAIVILDYNKPNKTIEQLTQMAHDRNYWLNIFRRVVLQK